MDTDLHIKVSVGKEVKTDMTYPMPEDRYELEELVVCLQKDLEEALGDYLATF